MGGKASTDPNVFILPDLGEGVHEAELISWKVEPGQTVEEHEILAEMETDKALVEVPSPRPGTIKTLHGEPGETLLVGNPLVSYVPGEGDAAAATPEPEAPKAEPAAEEREDDGSVVGIMDGSTPGMNRTEGKALAAPAVRRLARDLGVDIDAVHGTGIGGRVTAKDVKAHSETGGASSAALHEAKPARNGTTNAPKTPVASSIAPPSAPSPTQAPVAPPQPAPMPAMPPQPAAGYAPHVQTPMQPPMQPQMQAPQMMPWPYGMMPPMPYGMPGMMPQPGYGMGQMASMMPGQMPGGMPGQIPPKPQPKAIPAPAQSSPLAANETEHRVAFRGVRRTIADKLRQSVNTAVHFTVTDEADVTELAAARQHLNQQAQAAGTQGVVKLSFLPFVARAVALSLSPRLGGAFAAMNATVDEDTSEIVYHGAFHLGIATDTAAGLMVPVIPDADAMSPQDLARAIAETAASSRDRSIPRERLTGGTFTISNVGSHAGRFATPVINVPEVAILAVGRAYDGVVNRGGQLAPAIVMPLSLACDHRVIDGATAALALAQIKQHLEYPSALLS